MSMPHSSHTAGDSLPTASSFSCWTCSAWVVSLIALAGSLGLSTYLGLKACPLCLYQRTFVMGAVGVLTVGMLLGSFRPGAASLFSLPLAVGGLGVAIFHVNLERVGRLECPYGFFEIGSAPQQSLAILALLTVILVIDVLRQPPERPRAAAGCVVSLVLGVLFTWGAIRSSPPPCKPDYSIPLEQDGCRPPQKANPPLETVQP